MTEPTHGQTQPHDATTPASAPGGYPSAPQGYPSAHDGSASTRPTSPPPPLALAVKLMWAGAALSVIGVLVGFTQTDSMREQIGARGGMSASEVDAAVSIGMAMAVVMGLLAAGLWVLNAIFNAKGKKWARVLSTVLAGLALVLTLLGLTQPQPGLTLALNLLQVALAGAIVWLIWRPESSRYYEAMSAPRS